MGQARQGLQRGALRLIRTWRATRGSRPLPYTVKSRSTSGFSSCRNACRTSTSLFSRSHWTDKRYPRPDAPLCCPDARRPRPLSFFPSALLRDQQYGPIPALYKHAMRRESFHPTKSSPPFLSRVDSFATMPSHSSQHHSNSFVSSPTWSLNTLTGTTASSGSGGGLPVTPGLSPVSLPSPPGSARSVSMHSGHGHGHAYASHAPSTPGAPHMGTVPLPPPFQHSQRAHILLLFSVIQ